MAWRGDAKLQRLPTIRVRGPALDLIVPILCSFNVDQKSNWGRWSVILFGRSDSSFGRLDSSFGRLDSSLRETTPCVREVKKQHLVGRICHQLCQPEALGATASTLFWTHMAAHHPH